MAVRAILRFPHPALKLTARPLGPDEIDEAARVARDLLDTMRSFPGCVGIAAPQLDEIVRVVVVDVTGHPKADTQSGLLELVNPRVVVATGAEVAREGCLSIPDLTANVRRATEITVTASRPDGSEVEIETAGFEARCP